MVTSTQANTSAQVITGAVANIRPDLDSASRVWLAYSGGLDSTVLLHALKMADIPVIALHVNHGLSPNADSWQQHCIEQCNKLDCEIVVERVEVRNEGKGIENAARRARYGAFDHHVRAGDILLMAHHLDDDCETLLFRLLRGSGLKGISGIKQNRKLSAGGKILRPLLSISRNEILDYANTYTLSWVEDESNRAVEFDRNYLRETVLPLFEQRWPSFRKQFSNSVTLLRESDQLLSEYALRDLLECEMRDERLGSSICLQKLKSYSPQRINHVLRQWLDGLGYPLPGQRHLEETKKLFAARDDAAPVVEFGDCELRRFKERLYCLPRLAPPDHQVLYWDGANDLSLRDGGRLTLSGPRTGLCFEGLCFEVRFRRGGERCKPLGRSRSQTLKKLLQEVELEPWLRDRVPLVYSNGELIAVGDLWICDSTAVSGSAEFKFSWVFIPVGQPHN